MSELEKITDLWRIKINSVKSEEEAKQLILDMKPQLEKLTEKLFHHNVNISDTDEFDIDWINELSEYIINTIQLFLLYHVRGELNLIHLTLSEHNSPIITLIINNQEYVVDFFRFKNGTNDINRDAHRECYYRNESIWSEYRRFSSCFDIITAGDGLCSKMKDVFSSVKIEYVVK